MKSNTSVSLSTPTYFINSFKSKTLPNAQTSYLPLFSVYLSYRLFIIVIISFYSIKFPNNKDLIQNTSSIVNITAALQFYPALPTLPAYYINYSIFLGGCSIITPFRSIFSNPSPSATVLTKTCTLFD